MKTPLIVVFSGFNQRAVIAFLRTLKKHNIECAIIAKSSYDTIFDTEYKDQICFVRQSKELQIEELLEIFRELKREKNNENLFIAPSTEALNRILLKFTNVLKNEGVFIPLIEENLYTKISDKYSFGHLCEEYGIQIPSSKKNIEDIDIPFVAKPYKYFSQKQNVYSPQLIYTKEDKNIFKTKFDENDFYYQKFINGRSLYLLYYFDKLGNCHKYSQENIAQQPQGKSIVAAVSSSFHETEISLKFEYMFKSIKFRGLIMIEIKEEKGEYYMIEANPRFWGPSQLFVDSGINFFEHLLSDYELLSPVSYDELKPTKYFWMGGIVETQKNGMQIVSYNDNFSIDFLEDWLEYDIYNRKDTIKIFEKEII